MNKKRSLQERLDELYESIHNQNFLKQKGLGNEVPIFIFDYEPSKELMMRDFVKRTIKRSPISIIEINLFDLMIELFEDVGLDSLFELEEEEGTDVLFEAIDPVLQENDLGGIISSKTNNADLVFMTGVGSVFPLIRSHEVLNQLQEKKLSAPVVVFYPGEYTGEVLKLFNRIKSISCYRAFRI